MSIPLSAKSVYFYERENPDIKIPILKILRLGLLVLIILSCSRQKENSFSDIRDDNNYGYYETGDTRWMTENLVYLDEDIYNTGAWIWNCEETDFECCNNCPSAGKCVLYNWETAKTSCPDGWHLPGRKEWEELIAYYSSGDFASPNFSGFNLSFDGRVRVLDEFCLFDGNTFWTSDSEDNDDLGMSVAIQISSEGEIIWSFEKSPKDNAFYVRCVQDKTQ